MREWEKQGEEKLQGEPQISAQGGYHAGGEGSGAGWRSSSGESIRFTLNALRMDLKGIQRDTWATGTQSGAQEEEMWGVL